MAIIAKFISYDGGIAYTENAVKLKKPESGVNRSIDFSDIISVRMKMPRGDQDGAINIQVAGERSSNDNTLYFEDYDADEAVRFRDSLQAAIDRFANEPKSLQVQTPPENKRQSKRSAAFVNDPKPRKRARFHWWYALIAVLIIGFIAFPTGKKADKEQPANDQTPVVQQVTGGGAVVDVAAPIAPENDTSIPSDYKSALARADSYNTTMHMSKARLYDQLTSEYGDQFSPEAAQYAVDNVVADWNANALASAESYSETMHMSKARIYDQLTSDYGEQFTPDEAQYAIDNIVADWNANALATAKSYLDSMNMSPEDIRDQLTSEYGEKFTQEEADYAIANLG